MASVVRFDCFDVDLDSGQLRKNGVRVPLREQSFQVLASLLERPGEVVSREDLRRRLWPSDVFVDFENNLNTAVARLREALGDSAGGSRFVETLPRRGYRFVVHASDQDPLPARAAALPRLIVLPFVNLNGDPDLEYFADAMTEELIAEVASLLAGHVGVLARTTAMSYKAVRKDIARIGRELHVEYVVEGAVRRDGPRVTITAQLIRAYDETHVFAGRYEADQQEVFALRTRIAEAIVAHLALPEDVRASRSSGPKSPPDDLVAYEDYMKGRFLLEKLTPEALMSAKRYFESAITRNPEFALAHDAIAELYSYFGYLGYMPPNEAFSIGVRHARAAVEADDALAEAHAVLAEYHKQLDYDWSEAEREMKTALELGRHSPHVRMRHAIVVLMPHKRLREAVAEIEFALELDPGSTYVRFWLSIMFLLAREYDRAIDQAQRILEMDTLSAMPFFALGCGYRQKFVDARAAGQTHPEYAERAISALSKAVELTPGSHLFVGWLALAMGVCGRDREARAALEQLRRSEQYVLPTGFAMAHLGLGEFDAAFEWLDRAVDERDQMMMPILSYAHFDPIRDDPRFEALVRKMRLA